MPSKVYLDLSKLFISKSEIAGSWSSVFLGQGGDISRVRAYRPGDKLSRIHGPSLVKDELLVKEFWGQRRMAIWIVSDINSSISSSGKFEPINAKATRDSVALFRDLIQGAADFWGIKVSQDDISLDSQRQFFRNGIYEQRGSLVFLVSDFYKGPETYSSFLDQCRSSRIDLFHVFINTSWIWQELKRCGVSLEGVDAGGESSGAIVVDKKTLPRVEASLKEQEEQLAAFFKRQNMPCINLGRPDFSDYVREMTRCFTEKYRTHA